jgi:hypothetical protein
MDVRKSLATPSSAQLKKPQPSRLEQRQNCLPFEAVSLTTVVSTAGRLHIHWTSAGLEAFVVEVVLLEVGL